jgi:hypothetical protein
VLPPVPKDPSNDLMEWFEGSDYVFNNLKEIMLSAYFERIKKLHEMPSKARDIIWWPFTQHKLVPDGGVMVIDSRCGENFAVFKVCFECSSYLFIYFNFSLFNNFLMRCNTNLREPHYVELLH